MSAVTVGNEEAMGVAEEGVATTEAEEEEETDTTMEEVVRGGVATVVTKATEAIMVVGVADTEVKIRRQQLWRRLTD